MFSHNRLLLFPCSHSVYTCSSLFLFVCVCISISIFNFFLFIDITHLLFEVLCMYVCYLLFPINNNNNPYSHLLKMCSFYAFAYK